MMKQQYAKLRQFYRSEFRPQLIITAVAFLALILISFIAGALNPDLAEGAVDRFTQMIAGLGMQEVDGSISAVMLFASNLRAMVVAICYGFIPFIRLLELWSVQGK